MHHAVSGSDHAVDRKPALHPTEQRGECILMARGLRQILIGQRRSRTVLCNEMYAMSDALEFAVADHPLGARSHMPFEDREFDAGRAGVEDQNGVAHNFNPVLSRARI